MEKPANKWKSLGFVGAAISVAAYVLWRFRSKAKEAARVVNLKQQDIEFPPEVNEKSLQETGPPAAARSSLEAILATISVSDILVPTVVIGAFCYFLGWRYLYSYYSGFGIDPILFSFTVTDVVAAGWRMYILIFALGIFAAFLLITCSVLIRQVGGKLTSTLRMSVFFVALTVGLAIGAYVVYQFRYVWGAHSTREFYVWAFASLTALWMAFILGDRINRDLEPPTAPKRYLVHVFRIVFPAPQLWLGLILLALAVTLAFLSSWNGLVNSQRDREAEGRLQIATFYVDQPLSTSNGREIRDGVWLYEDMRFIFKTDKFYFAFRPEEVNDGIVTSYAIPIEHVVELSLRSWYDKILHP